MNWLFNLQTLEKLGVKFLYDNIKDTFAKSLILRGIMFLASFYMSQTSYARALCDWFKEKATKLWEEPPGCENLLITICLYEFLEVFIFYFIFKLYNRVAVQKCPPKIGAPGLGKENQGVLNNVTMGNNNSVQINQPRDETNNDMVRKSNQGASNPVLNEPQTSNDTLVQSESKNPTMNSGSNDLTVSDNEKFLKCENFLRDAVSGYTSHDGRFQSFKGDYIMGHMYCLKGQYYLVYDEGKRVIPLLPPPTADASINCQNASSGQNAPNSASRPQNVEIKPTKEDTTKLNNERTSVDSKKNQDSAKKLDKQVENDPAEEKTTLESEEHSGKNENERSSDKKTTIPKVSNDDATNPASMDTLNENVQNGATQEAEADSQSLQDPEMTISSGNPVQNGSEVIEGMESSTGTSEANADENENKCNAEEERAQNEEP